MRLLTPLLWGSPLLAWIQALAVSGITLLGLLLLRRQGLRRLAVLAEKTQTEWDDLLLDVLKSTRGWALAALSFAIAIPFLELSALLQDRLKAVLTLVFLLQAAVWGNAAVSCGVPRLIKRRLPEDALGATALAAVGFAGKLVVWALFLLLALANLGINVTHLAAGLGLGGIAIALALQTILGDLFASLSIVLDRPFALGDFVVIGDAMGTVEHIGLRTTRIRSLSGEQLVFSNGELLKSRIRNFQRMQERRVLFTLGITYDTPYEKVVSVPQIIQEILEAQPGVRFDRAHFKAFGDFSLVFESVYFVLDPDYNRYMDVQAATNLLLFKRFEEAGIEFAFPTQTIHLHHASPGCV